MDLRALTPADAPAYRALMLEAYALDADAFTSTPEERAREPLAWWERRIGGPGQAHEAFGAFDGAALVGSVALEYADKPKTRHLALLVGMVVRAPWRGRGLGAGLLQAALAAAARRPELHAVRLTVTDGNAAAIALYEAHGFVAWGTEPQALRTPDGWRAKVHMRHVLTGRDLPPTTETP